MIRIPFLTRPTTPDVPTPTHFALTFIGDPTLAASAEQAIAVTRMRHVDGLAAPDALSLWERAHSILIDPAGWDEISRYQPTNPAPTVSPHLLRPRPGLAEIHPTPPEHPLTDFADTTTILPACAGDLVEWLCRPDPATPTTPLLLITSPTTADTTPFTAALAHTLAADTTTPKPTPILALDTTPHSGGLWTTLNCPHLGGLPWADLTYSTWPTDGVDLESLAEHTPTIGPIHILSGGLPPTQPDPLAAPLAAPIAAATTAHQHGWRTLLDTPPHHLPTLLETLATTHPTIPLILLAIIDTTIRGIEAGHWLATTLPDHPTLTTWGIAHHTHVVSAAAGELENLTGLPITAEYPTEHRLATRIEKHGLAAADLTRTRLNTATRSIAAQLAAHTTGAHR